MKKLTTLLVMLLFTAGMAIAQNNDATINQTGNSGDVFIDQVGNYLNASVNQGGSTNGTDIDMSGGRETAPGFVTVNQVGASNDIIIETKGEGSIANATQQGGFDNLIQIVPSGGVGFSNKMEAFQDANTNNSEIYIDQNGDGNSMFTPNPSTNARQLDQENSKIDIKITHQGIGADVLARQITAGTNNNINLDIFGSSNIVDALQDNVTYSTISVTQDAPTINEEGGHFAKVSQSNGYNNTATVIQYDDLQTANITQDGNNNTSYVNQSN